MYANRPSGGKASVGHQAGSGMIKNSPDLEQLSVLPLSPLLELTQSHCFLLCALRCTQQQIVAVLHTKIHASKYSKHGCALSPLLIFIVMCFVALLVCKESYNDPVC